MSNIAIVGAGWLGFPLAKHLVKLGHSVYASTTSDKPAHLFTQAGIEHFVAKLNHDVELLKSELIPYFQDANIDTVIGCFPPGFRKGLTTEYAVWWQRLVYCAQQAGVNKLVMISSTSVYPDKANLYKESDACLSNSSLHSTVNHKSVVLLSAEQSVVESQLNYCIIRCAGLFGPNRHPGRFVDKMKQVSRLAPANMLHLDDAIGIIQFALQQLNNEVVNASSPTKVSKADFYQSAINSLQQHNASNQSMSDNALLDNTRFPIITKQLGKHICADKLIKLGYQFKYASPIDGLANC